MYSILYTYNYVPLNSPSREGIEYIHRLRINSKAHKDAWNSSNHALKSKPTYFLYLIIF